MRSTQALRSFRPMFKPTLPLRKSVHDEDQAAHSITQRLRKLRRIPPELIPLGVVVGIAVGFAIYSLGKKLVVDKTMRLNRQGKRE